MAKDKGLSCIAITDHDTYYHMNECEQYAKVIGITLIKGIELSCYNYNKQKKVHIVGLFLNDEARYCVELGDKVLEGRNVYHQQMISEIRQMGYDISFEDALIFSKSNTVFKMHLYQALKSKYPEINMDFYRKNFMKKDTRSVDKMMNYCSVKDGINAILKDGGIPILAHPSSYGSFSEAEEYVSYGLKGIEVNHPELSEQDQIKARLVAEKYDLLVSGGSDFHFLEDPSTLGKYGIIADEFEKIIAATK